MLSELKQEAQELDEIAMQQESAMKQESQNGEYEKEISELN